MERLLILSTVVVAAAAFALAKRRGAFRRHVLTATGAVGAIRLHLLFAAPRDYMVRFPLTLTILHPWLVAGYMALR